MQLMMFRRRSEVPEDRLVILRKQRESVRLVLRPRSDVRRREIAHIVHVEAEQSTHFRFCKQSLRASQSLAPQPVEIDPVFPIDCHRSVSWKSHKYLVEGQNLEKPFAVRRSLFADRIADTRWRIANSAFHLPHNF